MHILSARNGWIASALIAGVVEYFRILTICETKIFSVKEIWAIAAILFVTLFSWDE